jgi:hypothetical protein
MSLHKSSFKGYGCPYTNPALRVTEIPINPDLRVTDVPINPEAKPRLAKPDRLVFSLPEAEEPCDLARCQLCEAAWVIPEFPGPRPVEPDRPDDCLPEAELCDTARATRRVNAPSPLVDSKGQWALNEGAVGLRTSITTV